jgi:uncharacterized membrane protein
LFSCETNEQIRSQEGLKMIGFAVLTGVATYVGVKIAMRHAHGGGWGCRGRYRGWLHHHHHDRWGDHGSPGLDDDGDPLDFAAHPRRWRGAGSGFVLRAVMSRLGARPDQERVIRDAVEELKDAAGPLRAEGRHTREEIAEALRKPVFDEVLFGELFARHDGVMERMRKAVVGALARTHDVLDERQRQRLADIIAEGPRAFRGARW